MKTERLDNKASFHVHDTMRASSPGWRVWLDAAMFPLKLYMVAAVAWLIIWRSTLSRNESSSFTNFTDAYWLNAESNFGTIAGYVRLGYFLVALILLVGGSVQWFKHSHKAAIWSLAFGISRLGCMAF